jgi:hypothetical protein
LQKRDRKIGTGLSIPAKLKAEIDKERGDVSRSKYTLKILEKAKYREKSKKKLDESRSQPSTHPRVVTPLITRGCKC